MKLKIAYFSLGCKLNFSEASSMASDFIRHDFMPVPFSDSADVYIINTCSVTHIANQKSRQVIKRAINKNPNAIIIVTGCYAQLKPKDITEIQGVDYILGNNEKQIIESLLIQGLSKQTSPKLLHSDYHNITKFYPSWSGHERTRSFLKIQDGCNNFCSYCTIPLARGKSRNISIAENIAQAESIVKAGFKEIILTGVNIGDFGQSTNESFLDLIKELSKVQGIERYRISSVEPDLLHNEIIDFVSEHPKFMPHFHIPLQSGSDKMLKLMRRKYTTNDFKQRIQYIKSVNPDAFIGIDLIVGVPGETEKLFQDSVEFVKSLDISFIHVFTYSERENTEALNIEPKVPKEIRKQRSIILHELSQDKHRQFCLSQTGKERPVLLEHCSKDNTLKGFTDNYIKVKVKGNKNEQNNIKLLTLDVFNSDGYFISKTR
jgi:threonylcarbamoyladenosine tRNA methylthiotransferase MtaB